VAVASWAACTALAVLLGAREDGPLVNWLAFMLFGVCIVALVDTAVNDWLPKSYVLCTIYVRHLGYMGMAFLLVFLGWAVMEVRGGITIFALNYLIPPVIIVPITLLDLFHRHRSQL
jgi:hypothetical protein